MLLADIETNGLDPSRIHCAVVYDDNANKWYKFKNQELFFIFCRKNPSARWVFHNGLGFDVPVINRLAGAELIQPRRVTDTFVVSQLLRYMVPGGHSLRAWGNRLHCSKDEYDGGWETYTDEMLDYCVQDVVVLQKLFSYLKNFMNDPKNKKALRTEHDTAWLCSKMQENGFGFDMVEAADMHRLLVKERETLLLKLNTSYPASLKKVKQLAYRLKEDGEPVKAVQVNMVKYPEYTINSTEEGDTITFYEETPINWNSHPQRIELLWKAGWKPINKTDGLIKKLRSKEEVTEEEVHRGWKTNDEENLNTLPEDSDLRHLATLTIVNSRISSLVEWTSACKDDGRIHGSFRHIGSWTHRMSHSKPNSANIPSPFYATPTNDVEVIKKITDASMRGMFKAQGSNCLVGTDADGIQLRIFAHYAKDVKLTEAIESGDKEKGTDIHSMNVKALAPHCKDRDTAKTFIYAFLLGAGNELVAQILSCTTRQAKDAVAKFYEAYPGLKYLKDSIIPADARRGYFYGLDGRKIHCNSEHLMLAGYLQSGESIVMKTAFIKWAWGIQEDVTLCNFVHDEWQVECPPSMTDTLIQLQHLAFADTGKELELTVSITGSSKVGKSWLDTH